MNEHNTQQHTTAHQYRRRRGGTWAIVIILVGILFLLNSLGFVSWNVWSMLVPFWPVLLILFGIRMLLGGNSWSNGIFFVVSAIILLMLFSYIILVSLGKLPFLFPQNTFPYSQTMMPQHNWEWTDY